MKMYLLYSLRNITINILLIMAILGGITTVVPAGIEDLRITEVNPATREVEVTNIGTDSFTATSNLPFCHRLNYFSFIPSGTLFNPGESRVFTVTGLNPIDSDIWLYKDSFFLNSTSILTGLKYGPSPNVGKMSVAVTAGIWPSTTAFVPAPSTGQSLQLNALDANKPENWVSSTPVLGSFFGTGKKITDPLPSIPKGDVTIELEKIVDGLVAPLGMAVPDDGTNRIFIFDQVGTVIIIQNSNPLSTPFLDIGSRLVSLGVSGPDSFDERGLLGFALHPNFAVSPKVYTYTSEPVSGTADFTTPIPGGEVHDHQSVVAEWTVDASNNNIIDVTTRRELLRIDEPQFNHNAGALHFGPDGLLYIAVGDGGGADDEGSGHGSSGNGQNNDNVYGAILRIDVDGNNSANGNYGIPPDNPFVSVDGVDETYAYGFRNPYSFSFDTGTGILSVGDVGQNDIEEIDVVTAGSNYGWRLKEGSFFFDPNGLDDGFVTTIPTQPLPTNLIDPFVEYDHDDGISVIGGYVYRGTAIPVLQGRYVTGDFSRSFASPSGRLFYIDATGKLVEFTIGVTDRSLGMWLKGFGQDRDGEIYVFGSEVDIGPFGTSGKVLKIVPASKPVPDIKVNGFDGPITPIDNLSVTVALNPGSGFGDNADWWLAANVSGTSTIDGWYYFDLSAFEFVLAGASPNNLLATFQGPLFDLATFQILNIPVSVLPPGTYTFYLAVDKNMNGLLDIDQLFFDFVDVNITP